MDAKLTRITPADAKSWLAKIPDFQRKINASHVSTLKMAIQRGQWAENGATIVFDTRGNLLDGQHRLTAIAESGRSVWAIVVIGVTSGEATFSTIDDSKSRTIADFLHKSKNRNIVSTAMRFYWMTKNDFQMDSKPSKAPTSDILKICHDHIEEIDTVAANVGKAARMSSISGFFVFLVWYHLYIKKLDADRVNEFVEGISEGMGLNSGDPRLVYRNRLLDRGGERPRGSNFEMTIPAKRAILMKAFYAWMDKKQMTKLTWAPTKEEFPKLR